MGFDLYIGIDYSGEGTSTLRLANLQVYTAEGAEDPKATRTPAAPDDQHWKWNRKELADWLLMTLRGERRVIVGIDHAFSFPIAYFRRHNLGNWDAFLDYFCQRWPTREPKQKVSQLRRIPPDGASDDFRLTETWTSSAKSVFDFRPNGVAFSTHAGIPWLSYIREQVKTHVHFWPFDGWEVPTDKSVVAEVYPSLFRRRFSGDQGDDERTIDQQDAYSVARWLCETDRRGLLPQYLAPPLTNEEKVTANVEGWILGIT